MDAVRTRLSSALEWCIAAAFLAATIGVGSVIVRELRVMTASEPVRASQFVPAKTSTAVPPRAISVPVLLLTDGREIHLGASVQDIAELLGRSAEVGTQHVEQGRLGERLTRFYDYAGTRFVLVFEPLERRGPPRVVGIYVL